MSSTCFTCRHSLCSLVAFGLIGGVAFPVRAQQSSTPGREVVHVETGIDVGDDYMFRGVRQNSTGAAIWPFGDLAITAHSGEGPFKRVRFNVGFWDSLNTGDTGSDGPFAKAWYESRVYGAVGFQFGGGISVATTYTAYMSPSEMFTTVKEVGIALGIDDRAALGRAAVNPHALVALELDTAPGVGQLDGGRHAGRYLELGVAPGYSGRRGSIAVPIRVGVSLHDYYELAGKDNTFGFASAGAMVTLPLGGAVSMGRWSVHGGVEIQRLGETTKVFNGGDRSKAIASFGIRLQR